MRVHSYILTVFDRWQAGWRDILAASIAGGLAWMVAGFMFEQHQPIFAAIAAIASLAPGAPNHGKQAVALLLGVSAGVFLGEVALMMPQWSLPLQIMLVTALGLGIGAIFGTVPAIGMQAATSALLVILLGFSVAGTTRLYDVIVGAGIGLLFSQVLLTPDPIRLMDRAASILLRRLGEGLETTATALEKADRKSGQTALSQIGKAHASLNALEAGIGNARFSARWSLRGRLAAKDVATMAERYDRRAIRLYASTMLLAEVAAYATSGDLATPAPDSLVDTIRQLARAMREEQAAIPVPDPTVEPRWQKIASYVHEVIEALYAFDRSGRATHQAIAQSEASA